MTEKQANIHLSSYRYAHLNATASGYDRIAAAPSDSDLFYMWLFWMIITASVALICLVLFASLATSRKARRSSFNLYLMFLVTPDFLFSCFCCINCGLNFAYGRYISEGWCRFQAFYSMFGIGANAWLNSVIGLEIYKMLRLSSHRQRYFPPKHRKVVMQSLAVYLLAALIALLPTFERNSVIPLQPGVQHGMACLPSGHDRASTIFQFVVFLPLCAGVPSLIVTWIAWKIMTGGLLPKSGRTRNVALYFFRIIFVFYFMWLPAMVFIFIAGRWLHPWTSWAGGSWSHLQGAVSAFLCLTKPDVAKAVKAFLLCRRDSDTKRTPRRDHHSEESPDDGGSWQLWHGSSSWRSKPRRVMRHVEGMHGSEHEEPDHHDCNDTVTVPTGSEISWVKEEKTFEAEVPQPDHHDYNDTMTVPAGSEISWVKEEKTMETEAPQPDHHDCNDTMTVPAGSDISWVKEENTAETEAPV